MNPCKWIVGALVVLAAVTGASCASRSVGGSGSCAFVARHHDHTYTGTTVQVEPLAGRRLGVAVVPGCTDTANGTTSPDTRIRVSQIPGVPADVALEELGISDTVLVRTGLARLPLQVRLLLHAPACAMTDTPLTLHGAWTGILGADGGTELDMIPPYDLSLVVDRASAARYDGAFLDVRVPAALGRPLTEDDVHASLWKGGTITITATCRQGRYLAQRVSATPPS